MSTPQEKPNPTDPEEKAKKEEVEGRKSEDTTTVPQDGVTPDTTSVPQDDA
jgi:hypothetical protein